MEMTNFKKAKEILAAIQYAKETLKSLDAHGTTKYIKIGNVEFVNFNKGAIHTDGLQADTSISGYNAVYYDTFESFNDRVVSEFKTELKLQIIKLEENFKAL